ncbi:DUF6208 family protein [Oscillatoria sp. CS-180]|uniref:DUF6208 family protein n=1 Tax=Oscillatoria sp. CS-180 TaxID=3021720 RepID=UPI00232F2512|nr:DUF6208 family protein [Oscillatoria sp. CS-180]MDB9528683.1 DUF6208 family protein [Oscillatoria sp. CS-180]
MRRGKGMSDRTRKINFELDALWEIPLGVLSFLFSRVLRAVLTNLGRYYNPMNKQEQPEWQTISAEFLAKPIKLLWAMSRARWNLHSLIGLAGPFNVTESLSINVSEIAQSTPTWTAVFYTLGDYTTHANISSLTISGENEWETVKLPPGRYLVGLRHYHWSDPLTLPTIRANGQEALAAKQLAAPPDANRFYRDLIQRQGVIHACLNGYVYPLLRFRQWLPARFVRDVFLPVPNPETQFHYGALKTGERLQIQLAANLLETHEIFFSLYNRFCFPLEWYPVTEETHLAKTCDRKAVFIIRVHPKSADATFPTETLKLTTLL